MHSEITKSCNAPLRARRLRSDSRSHRQNAAIWIAIVFSGVCVQAKSQNQTSAFINGVPVGSTWRDVTASEGNNLRVDYQIVAFSGGGTANGRTAIFGGGHNNGMSDAVAFLDWRQFETVGWTEELISTADFLGVGDKDYETIGQYLTDNYNPDTPGGVLDSRGSVAISRHTYDGVVAVDDSFYLFAGALPFDNVGQPPHPWGIEEGDIWRYDYGQGWTFIDDPLIEGHSAAAYDSRTGDIWVYDNSGLRLFDTETGQTEPSRDTLRSQAIESFLNFNPDGGSRGTLFGAGQYANSDNWFEYDIASRRETDMGPVPGNVITTYIVYVDSSYGDDYGSYFAFVPADGTLQRWNGSGWDVVATGGPTNDDYVYGRVGFEEVHQVFYWIYNPFTNNDDWKTLIVRPFPFEDNPVDDPVVSLTADPISVPPMGMSNLSWTSTNATECSASGDWGGTKPLTGAEPVGPLNQFASYSLSCSGAGGTSSDVANVTVVDVGPAPSISFTADPTTVESGEFAILNWMTSAADNCVGQCGWTGAKAIQGSEAVGPIVNDTEFCLECSGPGGVTSQSVLVTANTPQPPPPPPPPQPTSGSGSIGLLTLLIIAPMLGFRISLRS